MPSSNATLVKSTGPRRQSALAAEQAYSGTDTEKSVEFLKRDIVNGALAPDTKLKIRELRLRYGFGASPLREALSQLAAQGFVLQASQRGFRVAPLSAADLEDITRSRQLIESEALRLAMKHGSAAWEAGIVSALHLLEIELKRLEQRGKSLDARFETAHSAFHEALVAGCPLPTLKAYSKLLYVQGSRYRFLMHEAIDDFSQVARLHRTLARLVLARKAGPAVAGLMEHIDIPARLLLKQLNGSMAQSQSQKSNERRRKK